MKKRNTGKILSALLVLVVLVGLIPVVAGCSSDTVAPLAAETRLKVGTTTSLYDTGLWSYLEPMFEEKYNVEVDVLSLGSGATFEYAKKGDLDVITIHDKANELKFISDNFGIERVPFAYNYFLIIGPASDPAGIKGMSSADAFKKLMETGSGTFISCHAGNRCASATLCRHYGS